MPKRSKPPTVGEATWVRLYRCAQELLALAPWKFSCDSDLVGIFDSGGHTRVAHVLGNAGEVFGAVFYRDEGVRWILAMTTEELDPTDLSNIEEMNCLKLEFVPKRELSKEDLAVINAIGFKPVGRGSVWPQFRSTVPGWHPWFIKQDEAEQLIGDVQKLIAFMKLFEGNQDLYDGIGLTEIPFVPNELPDRSLTKADLEWNPIVIPPTAELSQYVVTGEALDQLQSMEQVPNLVCEFDSVLVPGASFKENGRRCFGRLSILVDSSTGAVLGVDVSNGGIERGRAAGQGLVTSLVGLGKRPHAVSVSGDALMAALRPICSELNINLIVTSELPCVDTALDHLSAHFAQRID